MKLRKAKNESPKVDPLDKREEVETVIINVDGVIGGQPRVDITDPNDLLDQFLQGFPIPAHNPIDLTFDAMTGFVAVGKGVKKLDEPQLVIRANYVESK